tara:strand:- start:18518 stop:19543 length:1026 start_codon:yes stop_codon:yes gene_type:complete
MTHQAFVSKLGFNKKGYNLIQKTDDPCLVISGKSIDYDEKINFIKKKCPNIHHLAIGKERNSIDKIKDLVELHKKDSYKHIFVFGGGSIIDVAKIFFLSLKEKSENLNFFAIPTRIGSGAETSITSIINVKGQKIIDSNEEYLPSTVIYDTDIIRELPNKELLFGSMDSLVHCFESMTSFLSNPYLNFFSNQTIKFFFDEFKIDDLTDKDIFSDKEIMKLCILSFNGGLAQSNSGAGLCHAFAHAAEKITNVGHTRCITYFLTPVLEFIKNTNYKFLESNRISHLDEMKALSTYLKKDILELDKLRGLHSTQESKLNLLENAKKDPCWRLFNLKGDKDNII